MESDAAGGGELSSELGRDRHENYTAVKNIKGCSSHHLSTYHSTKRMGSIVVTEDDSLDLDKYFGKVSKDVVERGNDCSNDVLDDEQRQGKSRTTTSTSFVTTQTSSIRQSSSDGCINNSNPAMHSECSPALTSYSEGCIPSPAPATVSTQQSSSYGSLERLVVYPVGTSPAQQYVPMPTIAPPPFHMPMAPPLVSSLPLGPWPGRVGPGLNYMNAQQGQFNQSHGTTQYPPTNSIPIIHNQYLSQSPWTLHQTSGQMGAAHPGIGMARGHQNGQNLNYHSQGDHSQPTPVNATATKKRSTAAHHCNSNSNSNKWLEKDYKTGRTWTEDDHTTTSSRVQPRSQNLSTIAERDDSLRKVGRPNVSSPQMDMIKTHHPHAKHHDLHRTGVDHTTTEEQSQLHQVNTSENRTRSVRFGNVQVRTYETILTANPSCSSGPSIGIGWRYSPNHINTSVASYESQQSKVYGNYKPSPEELLINRDERETILKKKLGYNCEDLAQSVRETIKMKNQRKQTVDNLKVSWFEERVEVCTRVLGRMLKKRERSRHMYEEWKGNVGQNQKTMNRK